MGGHVVNIVQMVPNKRGPVEMGLIEVAQQWRTLGGRTSAYFVAPPVPWYEELLMAAGVEFGVVNVANWDADVVRIARQGGADLVHYHFGSNGSAGKLSAAGIAQVRTEHSFRPRQTVEPLRRCIRWTRQRKLDHIICVSDYIAKQTRTDFLASASKISVVHNGVDLERFRPRPDEKADIRQRLWGWTKDEVVLTVAAHLHPAKRQHLFIQALPEVVAQDPRVRLVVAGDGPSREPLLRLVGQLDLEPFVRISWADNDVPELYAASDIAGLTSTGEGLPSSIVEAQAAGLPVITTLGGGLPETYIDGVTGISVRDETPAGLATAILALTTNEERRAKMSMQARHTACQRFAMERFGRETCAVYQRVLASR